MSSTTEKNVQHVGPKVRVRIEYECNGCQYHKIEDDVDVDVGIKYHACCHPSVVEKYTCLQYFGIGNPDLTIYHTAKTPNFCPYIEKDRP